MESTAPTIAPCLSVVLVEAIEYASGSRGSLAHDADELLFAIDKHLLIADGDRGATEFG